MSCKLCDEPSILTMTIDGHSIELCGSCMQIALCVLSPAYRKLSDMAPTRLGESEQ